MIRNLYRKLSMTLCFFLMIAAAIAQERTVTGTVTDSGGNAMPGVNVVIRGISTGTTTDGSGKFAISAGTDAVLMFSFIGYSTQQVIVGSRSTVDVTLVEDAQQLNEVVVTALGIQRDKKALQ